MGKPMFEGEFGVVGLICSGTIANGGQEWEEEGIQLAAKAERGFVTQSLLWLCVGLSTRERNPTRGGLWLSFQRVPRISKTANAPCCGPGWTCSARAAPAASPRPTSSATTAQS